MADASARLRPSVPRRKRAVKKERLRGLHVDSHPAPAVNQLALKWKERKSMKIATQERPRFSYLRCGARIRVSIALEDSGYRKVKQHAGGTPHASWSLHGAADAVITVAAMGCMLPRPMDVVISKRVPSISHMEANHLKESNGDGQNWHPLRPLWT